MSYERLAARLYNTPLLITPEKAQVIEQVFRSHLDGTAVALPKRMGERTEEGARMLAATTFTRQRGGYMRSDSGVALIQVVGSLVHRGSDMDADSGLESYTNIAAQLQTALGDPYVRGILLEIDSPGGEANGVSGLADAIRAGDAKKPIVAHANESAFSAAYWLASAAGELYVPESGMVGSVGVIMLHVDQSAMNAKRGLNVTHITAGARKADFSPHAPLSEAALENAQGMVDRLYGQFVAQVAAMRGISEDAVRETEAGLLDPEQAQAVGMVDGIATLDATLARLGELMNDSSQRRKYGSAAAKQAHFSTGQPTGESTMSDATKGAAPNAPAAITPEQLAEARAAGLAEGMKTGSDAAKVAERTRVAGITGHAEAAGRAKLAEHLAHKTDMSVDDAVAMLAAAPKESAAPPADRLAAAMATLTNPNVGADAGEGGDKPKVTAPIAANVYAFRRQCVQNVRSGKVA